MNKKSQSALEYLQNYAWAILVMIIIGVTLLQLGVFNPPTANVATGFKTIKVLEPSIRYVTNPSIDPIQELENNLNFTITNTGGTYIHDLSISFSGDCEDVIVIEFAGQCEGTSLIKTTLGPGETTSMEHNCCNSLDAGDPFRVNVNINYTQRVGERKITKKESGVLQGIVEERT